MINFNYTFNYVERAFVFKYLFLGLSLFAANPFLNAGGPHHRSKAVGGVRVGTTKVNARDAKRTADANARTAQRRERLNDLKAGRAKNNFCTRLCTAIASCFKRSNNKNKKE